MRQYLTQQDSESGLRKWQAILHLQDWEITIALVPQTTFSDRHQVGDCCTRRTYCSADIRLATIDTIDLVFTPGAADMERSLVHELLHCVFRSHRLWPDKVEDHQLNHFEHGIEQMARALVELDRRPS